MAPKTKFLSKEIELSFLIHSIRIDNSHFSVFVCQNWMKNGQVMTMGSARGKVALSYFGP